MHTARLYLASSACGFAAAAAIAGAATFDHTHPRPTPQREWVSAWYCTNLRERCRDEKPWKEEWHARESRYTLGFAGSLTGATLFALAAVSRRRSARVRSYNQVSDRRGDDLA